MRVEIPIDWTENKGLESAIEERLVFPYVTLAAPARKSNIAFE